MVIDEETSINLDVIITLVNNIEAKLFELVENDKYDEAFKLAEEYDKRTNNRFEFTLSLNY